MNQDTHDIPIADNDMMTDELAIEQDPVMVLLANAMPWAISLLLHIGIFLLLLFVIFIVIPEQNIDPPYTPVSTSSVMNGPKVSPNKPRTKTSNKSARPAVTPQLKNINIIDGQTTEALNIPSIAGGGSPGVSGQGLDTTGTGLPHGSFCGTGGQAYNIVYVIDRSGSMIDTFDSLCREMRRSIYMLKDKQFFHIIFYSDSKPMELGNKQLVSANRLNKKFAASFLADIIPSEQTNPVPALTRAFEVLENTTKPGKLVYLLTDGIFPDNEEVLSNIASLNSNRSVQINTILYGAKPPEAEEVMKRIAEDNRGTYNHVDAAY